MVSFVVSWNVFQQKFLYQNTIYVLELEDKWCFYTYQEHAFIRCFIEKFSTKEENLIFIDRFFKSGQNIIPVMDIMGEDVFPEFEKRYTETSEVIETIEQVPAQEAQDGGSREPDRTD